MSTSGNEASASSDAASSSGKTGKGSGVNLLFLVYMSCIFFIGNGVWCGFIFFF